MHAYKLVLPKNIIYHELLGILQVSRPRYTFMIHLIVCITYLFLRNKKVVIKLHIRK